MGFIVVNMDRQSKLEVGVVTTVLEQDYFKLALECLSKAHNRYQRYCSMKVPFFYQTLLGKYHPLISEVL